ncbi:MAG: hypothetical protein NC904_08655, partial [Candidatus Omnitrophica bacterium]|nr:hypothetical protein [Candidatus Omnitrophota bacterium]
MLKNVSIFIDKEGKITQTTNQSYPATLPTANQPDRQPTQEELQTIINAFGRREALAERRITLDNRNVIISPSLESPAEVKGGVLYVNPNTLRGPPEQLKVIFEGHELYHLLNPTASEEEARLYTIRYLLKNNFLEEHIRFLEDNFLGLTPDEDWLSHLKQVLAYTSKENFESYIPFRLKELTQDGTEFNASKVNSYPNSLRAAQRVSLDEFRNSSEFEGWLSKAKLLVLSGGLVFQFLFAGAATRAAAILGGGAKYFFNPYEIMRKDLNQMPGRKVEDRLSKDQREKLNEKIQKAKYDAESLVKEGLHNTYNLTEKELDDYVTYLFLKLLQDKYPQFKEISDLTLGARLLFALRLQLEELARQEEGVLPNEVLSQAKLIIHVNDLTYQDVIAEFRKYNFFGFNPENILFIIQHTFQGYTQEFELHQRPQFRRPFGHGYTLMQTVHKGHSLRVLKNDTLKELEQSALGYFFSQYQSAQENNPKLKDLTLIMHNTNVDDLIKLFTPIDLDRLAFVLYLMSKGHNVVIETVRNEKGQKGGSWVEDLVTERKMLVEGVNLKYHELVYNMQVQEYQLVRKDQIDPKIHRIIPEKIEDEENPEYTKFFRESIGLNRMANYYKVKALLEYLPLYGLPNWLDVREDKELEERPQVLFMESITGDITQIPEMKPIAFQETDAVISTFKSTYDAIQTASEMLRQETRKDFLKLIESSEVQVSDSQRKIKIIDEIIQSENNQILDIDPKNPQEYYFALLVAEENSKVIIPQENKVSIHSREIPHQEGLFTIIVYAYDIQRKVRRINLEGREEKFFVIEEEGNTVSYAVFTQDGRWYLVNEDRLEGLVDKAEFIFIQNSKRAARPAATGIGQKRLTEEAPKARILVPANVRKNAPLEIRIPWKGKNLWWLMFNPFAILPNNPKKPPETQPYHITVSRGEGFVPQKEIWEYKNVLDGLRLLVELNNSPTLKNLEKFRLAINGWYYSEHPKAPKAGASQAQAHMQLMRFRFPIEREKRIKQKILNGIDIYLLDSEYETAIVLESSSEENNLGKLANLITQILQKIIQKGNSFNVFI